MAKKTKGKQKQEEKSPANDVAPVVAETSKPAVTMPTTGMYVPLLSLASGCN
jgi:hypothetical protein